MRLQSRAHALVTQHVLAECGDNTAQERNNAVTCTDSGFLLLARISRSSSLLRKKNRGKLILLSSRYSCPKPKERQLRTYVLGITSSPDLQNERCSVKTSSSHSYTLCSMKAKVLLSKAHTKHIHCLTYTTCAPHMHHTCTTHALP